MDPLNTIISNTTINKKSKAIDEGGGRDSARSAIEIFFQKEQPSQIGICAKFECVVKLLDLRCDSSLSFEYPLILHFFVFVFAVESLRGQPWFVGGMEREEAEEYLKSAKFTFLGAFDIVAMRGQSQRCTPRKKKKKTKTKKLRLMQFVCFLLFVFFFSFFPVCSA